LKLSTFEKKFRMNWAVILLGSNLGNRMEYLLDAKARIETMAGRVAMASPVYETAPWGKHDQPAYLNQVICIDTILDPENMLRKLLDIEKEMGRLRTEQWAPRLIDLDILYYGEEIVDRPGLKIPHPRLHERRFTLEPLAYLLPEMIHPILKKSHSELLMMLSDELEVHVLEEIPKQAHG